MNIEHCDKFISVATVTLADRASMTRQDIHEFVDNYPTMPTLQFELNEEEKTILKEN